MRKPNRKRKNTGQDPSKRNKRNGKKRPVKREKSPIMRANELREMLGVGKNTLYEWCKQDLIPHKRIGRVILFSRIKVKEWLENGEDLGDAS